MNESTVALGCEAGNFPNLTRRFGVWRVRRAAHPQAMVRETEQTVVLMVAVVLLTTQAYVINCLVGIPHPIWSAPSGR